MTDDLVITEFVDHDDRPTDDPDEIDRVLVTSLFGRSLPLIRYELSDIPVPGDRPCSCGAIYPLIREVKGRADDAFVYVNGAHVHPLSFRTPLGQNPNIEQYQVHQTETGARIGVIATGPVDVPSLKAALSADLAKAGLPGADIEIELVDKLERHKETGKLRRFVPLVRHNSRDT